MKNRIGTNVILSWSAMGEDYCEDLSRSTRKARLLFIKKKKKNIKMPCFKWYAEKLNVTGK